MSSCMAFKLILGIFSTKSRNFAAEMSGLPSLSLWKSSSVLMASFWQWARNAFVTACCASPATCFRAAFRATICFLHRDSKAPTMTFVLTSMLLASLKGPLLEVLMASRCSLTFARAFSTDSDAASSSFSPCSMAFSGLSSSAPRLFTSFSTAGMAASTAAVLAFISASTSLIMPAAAFLSAASCRFLLSSSTCSFIRFSDSLTFFFNCDWVYWTLLTRGLILPSSAFVSARGPVRTDFNSSVFCSKYFAASFAASAHSCRIFSMRFCKAACGEYGSK
mmetsp:Transcript_132606/g.369699  ORF Transcript_132606/g.369699 Transcript_132606/m.369699 type:complete len:278 (+) Transcript_132606:1675-2508(+)